MKLQKVAFQESQFYQVTFFVCRIEVLENKAVSVPVDETNDEV